MGTNKKIVIAEVLLIVLVSLLVGNPVLGNIFSQEFNLIDEGQFGAWAFHMLSGKVLYKDIYVTYGPGYAYPLYWLFSLFGPSAHLVKLYLLLGSCLGILFAYCCMHIMKFSLWMRRIALFFLLIFPVMQLRQGMGFLVIFLFLFTLKKNSVWGAILTGLSMCLTFLVSPDIGLVIFFSCLITAMLYHIGSSKVKEILGMGVGFFGGMGLFGMVMNGQGWLNAYVDTTMDVFRAFSGVNVPNGQNFPNVLVLIPQSTDLFVWLKFFTSKELMLYYLLIFYTGVLYYFFKKFITGKLSSSDTGPWLLFLYGFLMYPIVVTRSGIGHFFFVVSPALILGTKLTFFSWKKARHSKKKLDRWVFFALSCFMVFFILRLLTIYREDIGKNVRTVIQSGSSGQAEYIHHIEDEVRTLTNSSDTVFFFNNEPMMYLMVRRENATRYDLPFIAGSKEKRFEIVNSLSKKQPKLIIVSKKTWDVDGVSNKQRMPEVWNFIKDNYTLVKSTDDADLYVLLQRSLHN